MKKTMTTISVQINKEDKELANEILKDLGLNMSTYINMAIKQLIKNNGVPFEVVNPKPSKELLEALQEGEDILNGKIKTKGYHSVKKLFEDIENDK